MSTNDPMARIIAAYQTGVQIRMAREKQQQDAQDRQMQLDILKHEQDRLKLQQKIDAFKEQIVLRRGQVAPEVGPVTVPGGADLQGLPALQGVTVGHQPTTIPGGIIEPQPVQVPSELQDLYGSQPIPVPSAQMLGAQALQQAIAIEKAKQGIEPPKVQFAPPGSTPVITKGNEVSTGLTFPQRESTPVPGRDVPLSPEVEAQRIKMAGAVAAAQAAAKPAPEVPDLQDITSTTSSGRRFIDTSKWTGPLKNQIETAAAKSGIDTVNGPTAAILAEIDTAKKNQDYMFNLISGKLATDPTGRLYSAPANTIAKLAQTDPALATIGQFRVAAIQSIVALVSRGLRLNAAEIANAQENDIPKLTDTLPVALQRVQNLKTFLDHAEESHLPKATKAAGRVQSKPSELYLGGKKYVLQSDGTYK